ncbi:hypothetical protein CgunFtcFv8_003317 [Champsocephalus gunnari]|uniref:Uncharacterized protein n=1 Tax=Champsocephalus gunnari TaxID=52237 RepID=A0AAN8DBJ2_CHAGU|nr:hypothetical protein CgunFtcFv8_003317 [Champsocephalus gunnari]
MIALAISIRHYRCKHEEMSAGKATPLRRSPLLPGFPTHNTFTTRKPASEHRKEPMHSEGSFARKASAPPELYFRLWKQDIPGACP